MKKIYLTASITCFALFNAMGQATTPPPSGAGKITPKPSTSAAACDGSASFSPAPNLTTWQWFHDSTLVQNNGTFLDSLCGGNYAIKYIDSVNVSHMSPFSIGVGTSPPPGGGGGPAPTGFGTCAGTEAHPVTTSSKTTASCDGTAEMIVLKGLKPPFTFKWTGSTVTTKLRSGLCPGNYEVVVTDSVGCKYTDTAHVMMVNTANPCVNFAVHILPKNETAPGACDGSVEAVTSGGIAPFKYSWSGSNVTTKIEGNLCSGSHIVKVTDGNNCVGSDTTMLGSTGINTKPCQFFHVQTIVMNDTAHTIANACGGYIEAVCKGGKAPLTYTWAGNSTNKTPFNKTACQGNYTVTVSDSAGCSATVHTFVGMNKPPQMMPPPAPGIMPMHLFVNSKDATNPNLCNGKAYAKIDGGKPPYKINFGPKSATTTNHYYIMDSLCTGFYTINVMDADSSTASFVFVIGSPATTFNPPTPPFVNPVIVDTLVASAIASCVIDYDAIDSIVITHSTLMGAANDSLKATWTVFQAGLSTPPPTFIQNYKVNVSTGIVNLILDLICTNRASGSAKAQGQVSMDKLAGIDGVETFSTSVYPNPFGNQITIFHDKPANVLIIDITGRSVYSGSITAGTSSINTDHLGSGMYFINIKSGQKLITRKLIKP